MSQILDTHYNSTDTNYAMSVELTRKCINNRTSQLLKVGNLDIFLCFFNNSDFCFADVDDKVFFVFRISFKQTQDLFKRGRTFIDNDVCPFPQGPGDPVDTDGRTEEVINGKLEHVIIEESRKARQAEEQREAEKFESERGFLYRKYDREHVDMLYNCIVCDGMDSNLIDEFIEANPNLAEFSYGRQGNIVLLFITFHNDITYCYQVDAQGKTYDVTM